MSLGEEKNFLAQFMDSALTGLITNVTKIKRAYEVKIGRQVDQASSHISDKLNLPDNIRLIPQTPRSPELNPFEHLWEAIRENYFYNEVFESLEKVIDTLCDGLNFFNSVPVE